MDSHLRGRKAAHAAFSGERSHVCSAEVHRVAASALSLRKRAARRRLVAIYEAFVHPCHSNARHAHKLIDPSSLARSRKITDNAFNRMEQ